MNLKILNTVIPMASLLIFFVWGWIEGSYQHSWIIFMVSGMLMAILRVVDKEKAKDAERQSEKDRTESK
jgi:hypothetical protein